MTGLASSLSIAASGMEAQSQRLRHVSENIANADTPGYRRKLVPFEAVVAEGRATGEVRTGRVELSAAELPLVHDPSHPLAGPDGTFRGSGVELVIEVADAREAQRGFEANLRLFDQARQMTTDLLALLRR